MGFVEYKNYGDPLNIVMGSMIAVDGSIGMFCSVFIIISFFTNKEKTSFNLICLFRAIHNLANLFQFLTNALPLTLIGWTPYPFVVEATIFPICMSLYVANQLICILLAANRFVAIYFCTKYDKICGFIPTLLILLAIDGYFFGSMIYRFIKEVLISERVVQFGEGIYFSPDEMSPIYPNLEDLANGVDVNETKNSSMNLDSEIVVSFQWETPICAGIAVLLNLLTFGRIIYYYVFGCQMESSISKAKIKSNVILFLQTVLQDCTNLIDMVSMVVLSDLFHTRFWSFITLTFVWLNVHTIDNLVMLIFTDHKYLLKTFCCAKLCPNRLTRAQSRVPTVSVQLNSMA